MEMPEWVSWATDGPTRWARIAELARVAADDGDDARGAYEQFVREVSDLEAAVRRETGAPVPGFMVEDACLALGFTRYHA